MPERSDGRGPDSEVGTSGLDPAERELLDGFDRLRPQGSLQWGFDDAMRRIADQSSDAAGVAPWSGLPDNLWERGRGTKAAERYMGDVIRVVADRLAQDSRQTAVGAHRQSNEAIWDAIRDLAARVERIEDASDPLGIEAGELALPVHDLSEWGGPVAAWTGSAPGDGPIEVGELGDRSVFEALVSSGVPVEGVDPRGRVIWDADARLGDRSAAATAVLAGVTDHLRSLPSGSRRAVVLSGCIDRLALSGKVEALDQAVRVISSGGTLVLLVVDQLAWDGDLTPPVRDLMPGRPLHPETWLQILTHRGLPDAQWHRPASGPVHAVVVRKHP